MIETGTMWCFQRAISRGPKLSVDRYSIPRKTLRIGTTLIKVQQNESLLWRKGVVEMSRERNSDRGQERKPGRREARHLAKQRMEKRAPILNAPQPVQPDSGIPTNLPSYEEAVKAFHREQSRLAGVDQYLQEQARVPDYTKPSQSNAASANNDKSSKRYPGSQLAGRRATRKANRDPERVSLYRRFPRSSFISLLLISLLSALSAAYALSPALTKSRNYLIISALVLLSLTTLFFCIKSAIRVSSKLGLPLLLAAALALTSFIVGSTTQVVINSKPVLVGSALSKAVKIKAELTALGTQIESDRQRYLASTAVNAQALLDTFPKTSSTYQGISSALIKRDPTGLPSLTWEPANQDIALAAYFLATGVTRRIEALNTGDSTAISDVAADNQKVLDYLSGAYAAIQSAALKSGITPITTSTNPSNSTSNSAGGVK